MAINTYGDVVGWSNPNGSSAAFQFIGGAMDYPFGANVGQSSRATGINDARTVVGYAYDPNSGYDRAFILQGDSPTILGTFGGRTSYAYAINNDGAVVGIAQDATLYEQPFLYQNGAMTALPIPVGHVAGGALGISSNGVIAGFSLDPVYGQQPIIWNGPTFTSISLAGLPFGGGGAWAVNSSGTVIGYGTGVDAAWVWKDGQAHRLSDITDPGPYSGLQIQAVYGINDSGQMVGFARLGTSQGLIGGAVLLSPIPELSSAAMFAVGLSLLVLCRRRAMCRTDLCDR
ncbi:MAG TPA: hypothetical protein PLA97_00885 [Rubrivivax sp.]|nr:hypothetical protein [Rubrivivax sp.]